MKNIKKWLEPKRNKIIVSIVSIAIVIGLGFGVWNVIADKSPDPEIVFNENIVFEYGAELTDEKLEKAIIDKSKSTYTEVVSFESVDTKSVTVFKTEEEAKKQKAKLNNSNQEIVNVSSKDGIENFYAFKVESKIVVRNENKQKEYSFSYSVMDTKAPKFENPNKDITITVGDKLDLKPSKAVDPIDGEVEVKVTGEVDTNKPGVYPIKETAEDKHGNTASNEYKVTVEDSVKEESPEVNDEGNSNSDETVHNTNDNSNTSNNNGGGDSENGSGSNSENIPSTPDPKPEEPDNSNELDWSTVDVSDEFLVQGTDIGACHSKAQYYMDNGYNGINVGSYSCVAVMTHGGWQWGYQIWLKDDSGNYLD